LRKTVNFQIKGGISGLVPVGTTGESPTVSHEEHLDIIRCTIEATRGREAAPFDRTIDVQVGRLRKKLEPDALEPQIIKSVRGAGYILVPTVAAE